MLLYFLLFISFYVLFDLLQSVTRGIRYLFRRKDRIVVKDLQVNGMEVVEVVLRKKVDEKKEEFKEVKHLKRIK